MQAAEDADILAQAFQEDRIIVSADADFGNLLATIQTNKPSFILFRDPNLFGAEDFFDMLLPVLRELEPELENGCVAVFRHGRLRIRRLPF